MILVTLHPALEMGLRRQQGALLSVAVFVREREVMRQVPWVAGPRDKMVNLAHLDPAPTVETQSTLDVSKGLDHAVQCDAFGTE
jgi:hypothetical protein